MPRKTLETLVKETDNVSLRHGNLRIRWYAKEGSSKLIRKAKRINRPKNPDGSFFTDKQWVDHAKDLLAEKEREAKETVVSVDDPTLTLAELINRYIEDEITDLRNGLEFSTQKGYIEKARIIQQWPVASLPLALITEDLLDHSYLIWIKNNGKPRSNSYAKKIFNELNHIYKYAVKKKLVPVNIATNIKTTKVKETEIKDVDPNITRHLRKESEKYPLSYQAMIWVYSWCGLRLGELPAVRWVDINIDNGPATLSVKGQIKKTKTGIKHVDYTKTPSGIRTIPLPDELKLWLLDYRRWQQQEFGSDWNQRLYLLADKSNPFKTPGVVQDFIKILGEETRNVEAYADDFIDCPNIDVTFIRHAYCCLLINMGVKLPAVARYMGHKNIKALYKYANLFNRKYDEDIDIMNAYIERNISAKTQIKTTLGPQIGPQEILEAVG
tara:strand:- start:474 stop:1793 length:1320 start_codon:yes stop_codon:yes gene_type:complete